jgi:hypothetical protein
MSTESEIHFIRWQPPNPIFIKLKCDAILRENLAIVGIKGIINN